MRWARQDCYRGTNGSQSRVAVEWIIRVAQVDRVRHVVFQTYGTVHGAPTAINVVER
jgi:hypothetical protein